MNSLAKHLGKSTFPDIRNHIDQLCDLLVKHDDVSQESVDRIRDLFAAGAGADLFSFDGMLAIGMLPALGAWIHDRFGRDSEEFQAMRNMQLSLEGFVARISDMIEGE